MVSVVGRGERSNEVAERVGGRLTEVGDEVKHAVDQRRQQRRERRLRVALLQEEGHVANEDPERLDELLGAERSSHRALALARDLLESDATVG